MHSNLFEMIPISLTFNQELRPISLPFGNRIKLSVCDGKKKEREEIKREHAANTLE